MKKEIRVRALVYKLLRGSAGQARPSAGQAETALLSEVLLPNRCGTSAFSSPVL